MIIVIWLVWIGMLKIWSSVYHSWAYILVTAEKTENKSEEAHIVFKMQ